ncbi:uncharacterized protein LOC115346250 isoform X1 [Aquila chrysaetos chrysaetos]|uniref:uncharacterized protein LOC115346250 isoform X1 n=2 Tax=Aquila chrysaetos chrysaetos TaxID=223781 RepID=UPI0011771EF0|nr:uncharacterized protein LOC115346250 isoform X1 [Aquila chrysaetos chrysaetos]
MPGHRPLRLPTAQQQEKLFFSAGARSSRLLGEVGLPPSPAVPTPGEDTALGTPLGPCSPRCVCVCVCVGTGLGPGTSAPRPSPGSPAAGRPPPLPWRLARSPPSSAPQVYYSCGAVVESMERGLILSPGFPNNYYAGTHCVWQFFIPMRTHLILEIFDFDIFESSSETPAPWDGFSAPTKTGDKDMPSLEENLDLALRTTNPSLQTWMSKVAQNLSSTRDQSKDLASHLDELPGTASKKEEAKQASEENQSKQMKEPKAITKAQTEELPFPAAGSATTQRQNTSGLETEEDSKGKILLAHLAASGRDEVTVESWTLPTTVLPVEVSSSPQPAVDVCPHDVLYVSDLITFSSRFCGPNSPLNKTLVFGSSLEMVEVIMELITTTDRGRGFAMLFEYKNITEPTTVDAVRQERTENMMMLAIITGIVFFALALLSALCIACRQRTCPKRSSSNACSDQENGIQNSAVDINELQLVVPSRQNENNNHSVSREQAVTSCRGSTERSPQDTDPDVPSSISAVTTETGSDEVFIISAGPGASGLSFTTYRIQDKNLKRSVTSPASVSDWLTSNHTAAGADAVEKGNVQLENHCPRQRTWSARTFHDFLAPIPQLQKKWCSWTTNSPFTKLVDNSTFPTAARSQGVPTRKVISATEIEGASGTVYSDSSASNASYPLTLSAQRQRKLSSCNLKKSRFGNPYFGFLASSPDSKQVRSLDPSRHLGAASPVNSQSPKNLLESSNPLKINLVNGSKTKELMVETDKNKPVFVISEEGDDQQPLVLAEHLSQCGDHLSEQNAVYAAAVPDKQPVVLTVEGNSSASFTSNLPLWAKSPSLYKGHVKAPGSSRDQQSLSVGDANTTEISQNCDTLAAPTLCQASVQ